MAKRLVRYKRENGQLVKIAETPVLENGKVDISWLPVVGTMGSAVIERGSNANGEYVKFADGTMHCWSVYIPFGSDPGVMQTFTYPAAFAAVPIVLPSVAIYMGNNKIVHASNSAPHPRGGIKISNNARYRRIVTVRRIVK